VSLDRAYEYLLDRFDALQTDTEQYEDIVEAPPPAEARRYAIRSCGRSFVGARL
jgi:hypothetical protein